MVLKWVKASFLYLIIAALLGVLLRYILIAPIEGLNFRYLLHAHSHVAFLGWVFNALFAGLVFAYVPEKATDYRLQFWLLQIAVVGMLITFPIQGYAAASISFSTLHIFLSWWFAAKFYQDTHKIDRQNSTSLSFVRWGLIFMVVSAIGPFALGAIMAQGLSASALYNLSIYFYLHFQYNGWFSFAVFGLFFWFLENNDIPFSVVQAKNFLILMLIATIPGYALSALWTQPAAWVYVFGFIAGIAQLLAFVCLLAILIKNKKILVTSLMKPVRYLLFFTLLALLLKGMMQFASAFPAIADLAYKARNFTIGYLHIVFLGFVSVFLIAWFCQVGIVKINNRKAYVGIVLFLIGFIISELIIFLQPFFLIMGWGVLPHGNECLFAISLLMPIGIVFFFMSWISSGSDNRILS